MATVTICDRCGGANASERIMMVVEYSDTDGNLYAVHERYLYKDTVDLCETCNQIVRRANGEGRIPIRRVLGKIEFDNAEGIHQDIPSDNRFLQSRSNNHVESNEQIMFGETYTISDRQISKRKAESIPKIWVRLEGAINNNDISSAKDTIYDTNGLTVATMVRRIDGTSFIDPHALHTKHSKNSIGIGFDSIIVDDTGVMFYMREKKVYLSGIKKRDKGEGSE